MFNTSQQGYDSSVQCIFNTSIVQHPPLLCTAVGGCSTQHFEVCFPLHFKESTLLVFHFRSTLYLCLGDPSSFDQHWQVTAHDHPDSIPFLRNQRGAVGMIVLSTVFRALYFPPNNGIIMNSLLLVADHVEDRATRICCLNKRLASPSQLRKARFGGDIAY